MPATKFLKGVILGDSTPDFRKIMLDSRDKFMKYRANREPVSVRRKVFNFNQFLEGETEKVIRKSEIASDAIDTIRSFTTGGRDGMGSFLNRITKARETFKRSR